MYAIPQGNAIIHGRRATDSVTQWWNGKRWSPARNEVKVFETERQAKSHAEVECESASWVVVEWARHPASA